MMFVIKMQYYRYIIPDISTKHFLSGVTYDCNDTDRGR